MTVGATLRLDLFGTDAEIILANIVLYLIASRLLALEDVAGSGRAIEQLLERGPQGKHQRHSPGDG